jgi:uroporphyrinogen decarboxylase
MTGYNGIDRVKAAFKGKFADMIPAYPIMGAYTAKLTGLSIKNYFKEAKVMVQSQYDAFDRYSPDVVVMMGDLTMEAEAFGAKVDFFDDAVPQIRKSYLEDKSRLQDLVQPDPKGKGRMPFYLEACERIAAMKLPSPIGSVINGPWATSAALRGLENIIMDTFDDEAFIHNLMEITTETTLNFATEISKMGIGVSLSEAPASCSVISPDIYEKFILPYHQKIVRKMAEKKAGITIHVCGSADPILDLLVKTGASAYSIDNPTSLEKTLELCKDKYVVIGNVSTNLFQSGSEKDMEDAVKECLDLSNKGTRYILSSGCEVPITARPENVSTFMESARKFGRIDNES